MLVAILSAFAAAALAPMLHRLLGRWTGWILALLPAALCAQFLARLPAISAGGVDLQAWPWLPDLGISLALRLDGLALIFALLISGIGALVLVYTGGYLKGDPRLGRAYGLLLAFLGSMLGLVCADDLITLLVFWELTGVWSYFLIGFDSGRPAARAAALQALLVTGIGGLALLAGALLLGDAGGTWRISELAARGELLKAHPHYRAILLLVLAGAFTKSAQVPFHFWLPGAMEAPAPVSAYLHSATMVKAGVYLLARLHPALGATPEWHALITLAGATTMLAGVILALGQQDLKKVLAYTTVSGLGTLVLLLGLGTRLAMKAGAVFLLVHALYKSALFMTGGTIDHETGTRDLDRLSGLRRAMPRTSLALALSALSMAGMPPLLGFLSKELLYEAKLQAPGVAPVVTPMGILTNVLLVTIAAVLVARVVLGHGGRGEHRPHEAPPALWLAPLLPALAGLLIGGFPDRLVGPLIESAVAAVGAEPVEVTLKLWHGFNLVLVLSILTVMGGLVGYRFYPRLRALVRRIDLGARLGPARIYERALAGMLALAGAQTRLLQHGYLRRYILVLVVTAAGLGWMALAVGKVPVKVPPAWDLRVHEACLAVAIGAGALAAVRARSRLAVIACLGVVGYGVALVFILFGAPDLAMTQFLVETLTVIVLVLVFYSLPRFASLSSAATRARDALVALAAGGLMTALVLAVGQTRPASTALTDFYARSSLPEGLGRNVVNVILVDFRALDTLGEITVLTIAALGVFALLKRPGRRRSAS